MEQGYTNALSKENPFLSNHDYMTAWFVWDKSYQHQGPTLDQVLHLAREKFPDLPLEDIEVFVGQNIARSKCLLALREKGVEKRL